MGGGRVGQRRSIAEENCRYGEIAVVDLSDDCSAIGMVFNIDFLEADSGLRELRLEPYAVAAPAGGEDGRRSAGRA